MPNPPHHEVGDEEHTIARARSGDTAAFRDLYQGHVRAVYALALRLTAEPADAEDLTQDVFVMAWRRLNSYRGDSAFGTWLYGITVRLAQQRWRSVLRLRRREARAVSEHTVQSDPAAQHTDFELERAIASLPLGMRTALVLYAIEGFSQADVARLMGIAEGTVKAHVHRARHHLKERMDIDG